MRSTIVVVLALLTSGLFAQSQDISCKDATVAYEKPSEAVMSNIRLSSDVTDANMGLKKKNSPQGTRWFINVQPDYMKPGPWSTSLVIGNRSNGKAYLKAFFRDHGNTFSATWLNEKLIHIQVRIASSDLILDVEKETFIYNEVANYRQVTFCKEQ